jgi:UDP-N-acetylglucosamine 2-epimerase
MEASGAKKNGSSVKWVSIVGARPQFVKLAPVCRAIESHNRQGTPPHIDHCIIHTGQHYDREVAELLFVQMQIPTPNCNLAVGSGSHGVQLARMLARLEPILVGKQPDWVVVYGDTNSTLAGTLLSARLKLPLAHVEAGCRIADPGMPEEQNRIVADHLSRLLLAPSQSAVENLHREGIGLKNDLQNRRAVMVGDLMYDALLQNLELAERNAEDSLRQYDLESGKYYLFTLHRAENTDCPDSLRAIVETVGTLELPVLFPVHPRTKHFLENAGVSLNRVLRPVAPLGYLEMLALEKHARKILTDSGGVQKEAFYLGVPCVTLREKTEWPETVELGANRVAGSAPASIREAVHANHQEEWPKSGPYGDGNSANKIVSELLALSTH